MYAGRTLAGAEKTMLEPVRLAKNKSANVNPEIKETCALYVVSKSANAKAQIRTSRLMHARCAGRNPVNARTIGGVESEI